MFYAIVVKPFNGLFHSVAVFDAVDLNHFFIAT